MPAQQKVAAVNRLIVLGAGHKAAGEFLLLRRNECGRPIFVGNAEPALFGRLFKGAVLAQIFIIDLNQAAFILAKKAQRALMQDKQIRGLGPARAGDLPERVKRLRRIGTVFGALANGEQIITIDRNMLLQHNAFGCLVAQRYGCIRCQSGVADNLPNGLVIGQGNRAALRGDKAMMGLPMTDFALAIEQTLARCIRADAGAIIAQNQIVKARAHQRDGAGQ